MLRTLVKPVSVPLVVPASLPSCSIKPDCGLSSVMLACTGISSVDRKRGADCTSLSLLNHVYKDGVTLESPRFGKSRLKFICIVDVHVHNNVRRYAKVNLKLLANFNHCAKNHNF